jgi:hypothetical protein
MTNQVQPQHSRHTHTHTHTHTHRKWFESIDTQISSPISNLESFLLQKIERTELARARLTPWQAANWQFGRLGLSCCFIELEKSKQVKSRKTTLTDNQELPGAAPVIRPEPSLNQEYLVSIGYGNSPKYPRILTNPKDIHSPGNWANQSE